MAFDPASAVYGMIAVSALLAAESPRRETYLRTVAAVLVTLLLYWLAHSYAELAGERLRSERKLSVSALAGTMRHETGILVGAALPLVPLLLFWVTGGSLTNAVAAAVWTSVGLIVVVEMVAAVRAELKGAEFLKQVGIGAVLGLMVVALKVLLH